MSEQKNLNKDMPLPLYHMIKQDITDKIKKGEYEPGDKLPTEKWLVDYYKVSRMTLRKAMDSLIAEGLLVREHGKGIYVAEQKVTRNLNQLSSLHHELTKAGIQVENRIISYTVAKAGEKLAAAMGISEDTPVITIARVRMAGDAPICFQKSYMPEGRCGMLDIGRLQHESLYDLLEQQLSLSIFASDVSISAKSATEKLAEYLGVPVRSPLLYVESKLHTEDKTVVEFSENYYVPSRYKYEVTLYR